MGFSDDAMLGGELEHFSPQQKSDELRMARVGRYTVDTMK
jgi:hypothetical protein